MTVTHSSSTTDIPCDVDLSFSGGIVGHVTGPQEGRAQRGGPGGTRIGVSTLFKLPGPGTSDALISFQLSTVNGLTAVLNRMDTGEIGLWNQSQNPGSATLAPDGSLATVAITVGGDMIKVPVHIVGSIVCPPAAPPA